MKILVDLKDLSIPMSFYMPETGSGSSVREWPVNRDDVRILHDLPFKPKRLESSTMFTWGEPLASFPDSAWDREGSGAEAIQPGSTSSAATTAAKRF